MATRTRAKSAKAGRKDRNPKQTIKCKFCIDTHEDEGHCSASVRSEDTVTTLQDTANAAANVSTAPLDSIEPAFPQESAEVPSPAVQPEWNGTRLRNEQLTEIELDVAEFLVTEDFRSRWVPGPASEDAKVAATTMLKLKTDPNYIAPVQKRGGTSRRGRRS